MGPSGRARAVAHPMDHSAEVVLLLDEWRRGDQDAYDRLIPLVYGELRRLAHAQLRHESPGHSLQPTVLVHEAYLRLADADIDWQNRTHFLSVAARVMRRILVEWARARRAEKRGGDGVRVTFTDGVSAPAANPVDVLDLDQAMERLQSFDNRQAQVVELSYFGGLTYPEIGRMLGISEAASRRIRRSSTRCACRAEVGRYFT